jgi:hypothetical protein
MAPCFIHHARILKMENFDASIESVSKHLENTMKTEVQMVSTYSFQAGRKDGMIPGFIEV